jgi:CO/xanthine dehydrogenase FAD-binding subunit
MNLFDYCAPTSRAELYDVLADAEGARVLAGGTDLLVDIRAGVAKPTLVVDVKKADGFAGIEWSESEGLTIGPAVTINELIAHHRVRTAYPLLAACGETLASSQLRNRATVVGNIVNASPCADMAPGLLCLDARVEVASRRGRREIPIASFFTGVKKTVVARDEIVERIVVPPETAEARGAYRKLKRINGHDLALVGVALARSNGDLRVAVAAAAPTPVLVEGLSGDASADEVAAATRAVISPIGDVRCSKEYRQHMVEVYVRRLFEEVRR